MSTPPVSVLRSVIKAEFAARTPGDGICDPAVNVGFPPASTVDADPELGGERALGDLAVNGRPGQPAPGEDGFQADDTLWRGHGLYPLSVVSEGQAFVGAQGVRTAVIP